nr:ATP-binding protein [Rhizohabitans arisaemae]
MEPTTSAPAARLTRPLEGRLVMGVCQGVARHLGQEPVVLRLAFLLLTFAHGLGLIIYAVLWVFVPQEESEGGRRPVRDTAQLIAYTALGLGLFTVTVLFGGLETRDTTWPLALGGLGALILWQQADPGRRQGWASQVRQGWIRMLLGLALVVTGGIGVLVAEGDLKQASSGILFTLVVLGGVSVIVAPWLVGLVRELRRERRERIRQEERAEVAAHVHDSVLHTLTLIQLNADNSREVARLARAQERELRNWLYQPKGDADATLAAAVRRHAAEVEDDHGVPIEVVCVGDRELDDRLQAMLQAMREAAVNAAKHAETHVISVYAEVEPEQVMIFVRDRGKGFEMTGVPGDRMGVRQSIIGRMERHGGTARVRTAPGEGTEVMLTMGLT